jgi:hypothetical protein
MLARRNQPEAPRVEQQGAAPRNDDERITRNHFHTVAADADSSCPAFVPGIHDVKPSISKDVDGRDKARA